jgi:hypothetical protein
MRIILIFLLFTIASCDKYPEMPYVRYKPEQTQEGKQILWCSTPCDTISARGEPGLLNSEGVSSIIDTSFIRIKARASINTFVEIILYARFSQHSKRADGKPLLGTKYYLDRGGRDRSTYTIPDGGTFVADTTLSYIMFTRFDDSIVAGTFEFHGQNQNTCTDITDGFFDVRY